MSADSFISGHGSDKKEIYDPAGATNNPLGSRELKTSDESGGKDKYYYLVVQYPNKDDQTKSDNSKTIQVSLSVDSENIRIAEDK